MGADHSIDHPVIFFDGVCNLCNASVQFIVNRDKAEVFKFASLQSEFAQVELFDEASEKRHFQSLVLRIENQLLTKSTAALTIARKLSGGWPLLYAFIILPKFIRDPVYDVIARNRYKWFGKRNECMIPSPALKKRFIE